MFSLILGCDEQMWDCEGEEVDNFVVKKTPDNTINLLDIFK